MEQAALITGAAKRIGRAIALALAAKGYDIALHYRASQEDAERTAGEIRKLGRKCSLLEADLGDMKQVLSLVGKAFEALPHCNLLVNSASLFERGTFLQTEEEFFDRTFAVNFKTPFFLSRDFARKCSNGQIINLLDAKIAKTVSNYFVYLLTKKALAEFTTCAAKALAPGIRVNGVCPGPMLPPPGESAEYLDKLKFTVPLGRLGNAELIAHAVAFLAESDYITGQWLYVDGGQHLP